MPISLRNAVFVVRLRPGWYLRRGAATRGEPERFATADAARDAIRRYYRLLAGFEHPWEIETPVARGVWGVVIRGRLNG